MSASIARALLSVSDRTGLVDFARALSQSGIALVATGGTARALQGAGLAVTEVGAYTGFPEMLDGRVKTLHPKIHAGILARRDLPEHAAALVAHDVPPIDLVVVNLYPFRETVAREGCTLDAAIEEVDIGGPTLVRAAAKNWRHVGVVVDPADYPAIASEIAAHGALCDTTRYALARKAFAHTAAYDGAIANWLGARDASGAAQEFPERLHLAFGKFGDLRYGENPHQRAAFYRDPSPRPGSLATFRQLQGKELSYNNLADADAAWECARSFPGPTDGAACVIVKHANPCGVAVASSPLEAYRRAFATDPTAAFGGVIAFSCAVDAATLEAVAAQFVEVLIAPAYAGDALAAIAAKKNVRVLEVDVSRDGSAGDPEWDLARIGGGLLVQTADRGDLAASALRTVTRRAPTPVELADLQFAWRVVRFVKSNAIVHCGGGRTLAIGAGQMSRVDAARVAAMKARESGLSLAGSVVASDAFFPFRDGLDVVADHGAVAVIQPGGSMRDDEVIAAADARGIAMVVTGVRHFRH